MAEEKVTKTTKTATPKAEKKAPATTAKKAPAKKVSAEKAVEKEVKAEPKKVVASVKGKTVKFAKIVQFTATGRRKKSIARVRLLPNGSGKFVINGKDIDVYFGLGTLKLVAKQALVLTGTEGKYDVYCNVHGGGLTGQSGAIRHGIARALVKAEEGLKPELKKAGFLTRDSRAKERKKYGLKKARKAPQFRKR